MLASRYEIKFLISAAQKDRFMRLARTSLVEDPAGDHGCYRVTSQYFDTPDFRWYWEKLDGIDIRQKVRLRTYGEAPRLDEAGTRAGFLEIKHRIKDSLYKERVRLTPQGTSILLESSANLRELNDHVVPEDRAQRTTINAIERWAATMQLRAVNVISYRREAWMGSVDHRLRLTFDSVIHAHEPHAYDDIGTALGLPLIPYNQTLMELKFDRVVPRWIRDIVAVEGVRAQRFSKYATGVEALQNFRYRRQLARHRCSPPDSHAKGVCP